MELNLGTVRSSKYHSTSQKVRVVTERWVNDQAYCPKCGRNLIQYNANKKIKDFYCKGCGEDFELKSKKKSFGNKITDGAYSSMKEILEGNKVPNFFFLAYFNKMVENFFLIPKHYFVMSIIEKRAPLSPGTKREGWVGCNILLKTLPESGKIYYIKNRKVQTKNKVIDTFNKTKFLSGKKQEKRGWMVDVMKCVEELGKKHFSLDDVYRFTGYLSQLHPENKNIKPKIRQQLQFLRDEGYLKFRGKGRYVLNDS